jgi:drug/metabolite transporter (DMT)-like permease
MDRKIVWTGFAFSFLWASASTATKIGLQSAQPFVIAITRFFIAGVIMLLIAHGFMRKRLPVKKEWRLIMVYGLLNISIYLGVYLIAMQKISAGLGSLAVAINPVMISFIAAACVWPSYYAVEYYQPRTLPGWCNHCCMALIAT